MGADGGREAELLGPEFTRGVESILAFLGADEGAKANRTARIRQMAELVGAVVLARAVGEGELQEEILARAPGAFLFSPKLIVFARANVRGLVINSAPPLNEYWAVSKQ